MKLKSNKKATFELAKRKIKLFSGFLQAIKALQWISIALQEKSLQKSNALKSHFELATAKSSYKKQFSRFFLKKH